MTFYLNVLLLLYFMEYREVGKQVLQQQLIPPY